MTDIAAELSDIQRELQALKKGVSVLVGQLSPTPPVVSTFTVTVPAAGCWIVVEADSPTAVFDVAVDGLSPLYSNIVLAPQFYQGSTGAQWRLNSGIPTSSATTVTLIVYALAEYTYTVSTPSTV